MCAALRGVGPKRSYGAPGLSGPSAVAILTTEEHQLTGFAELGLSQGVLEAIDALEYREPLPIQVEAIPVIMRGRDIIGQAQTGSGKTAAFGLPAVEQIDETSEDIQVLVLTPTRELCIQVAQALRTFSEFKGVRVVAVLRRPAHPGADRAAPAGPADRGRHARPRHGPDPPRLAAALGCALRRARRGRRDALARLHGRRRVDSQEDAVRPPDAALLGHDARADPQARRSLPVRARAREGRVRDAHGRDDRPGHRRGRAEPQARRAVRRARARPSRTPRSSSAAAR